MITHQHLLEVTKIIPTDYKEYGGTVERWEDENKSYPDCSCGCKHYAKLEGNLGFDWGVCTKKDGPRVGLLTFEHQAGFSCYEEEVEDVRF